MKTTELNDRKPTMDDVRRGLRGQPLDCLDRYKAEIVYTIAAGEGWVIVIGDEGAAGYEWVYVACSGKCYIDKPYEPRLDHDEAWECSNVGYGGVANALRDGLIRAEGLCCPDCHRWLEESDIKCQRCWTNQTSQ